MDFSTRRAAQASGLTEQQVRTYVRAGLLRPERGPRGDFRFSFRDVVVLRTGHRLSTAGIPTRRIVQTLRDLGDPPSAVSLSAVQVEASGGDVVVRDGTGTWDPATGQRYLNFEPAMGDDARPLGGEPGRSRSTPATDIDDEPEGAGDDPLASDRWFEEGMRLEELDPEAAAEAYRRALAHSPEHGAARANLGRLLHEQGDLNGAERQYRLAVASTPDDPTAAFNLGVVLEDLGNHDGALAAYRSALEIDPSFASAHFNVGRLLEARGEKKEALAHFVAYRRSTRR